MMRHARERRGLTQQQVADMIGITQSGVSIAEYKEFPTLQTLERYADALGYRLEVLFVDQRPRRADAS